MSAFYKDTRFNGKLVRLEDVIQEATERAIQVIDDSLYELIGTSESNPDEFYMDYKEAFGHVVEELQKFHNVEK
jgi:Tfp pilus assembly ATPase PilU